MSNTATSGDYTTLPWARRGAAPAGLSVFLKTVFSVKLTGGAYLGIFSDQ